MLVLFAVAACSAQDEATDDGLTLIRFATDWTAQAEHGGFYQAVADGEYEARGLDVRIFQGGPGVNVPQLVASGAVDMGMGSNGFIILNLVREDAPIKAVSASFQKDPQVLMAHPDQGIESIADMAGRPILLSDASISGLWPWLKSRFGFSDDQVRATPSPAIFAQDARSILQGYVTSDPMIVRDAAGFNPEVFLLADEGYPGYAAMTVAPDSLIEENPEAVRAFVEATAAGWESYLNGDPSAADALIIADNPEKTPEQLAAARDEMRSRGLVLSGDAAISGAGTMTDERWTAFFEMSADLGLYPADMNFRDAYTLDFVSPAPD